MLASNNAEGGSHGTTVTTGNSGGASGNAWSAVSLDSQTIEFSSTQVAHGDLSYHFALSGTGGPYVYWSTPTIPSSNKTLYARAYIYHATSPATTGRFLQYSNSSFQLIAGLGIDSSDRITVKNSANTTILTSTTVVPTSSWFCVEFYAFSSATVGEIELKIYLNPDSGTPTEVLTSSSSENTRGSDIYAVIFGLPTAVANADFYIDNLAVQDTGYVGAASGPPPPPLPNIVIRRNTAEGQSDGTTLTAANSGGGSGDAFASVTTTGTIGRTYSNEMSMFGTQSYKVTPSASSALYCRATNPDTSYGMYGTCQMYLYLPSYASTNQLFMAITNIGDSNIAQFSVNQNGAIIISNAAGTNLTTSSSGVFPTGQWMRLDLITAVGTTTSNGRIAAQLSYANAFTPSWSYDSGAATNTGTTLINEYRFGKLDTTPNISGSFYFDNPAWRSNIAAFIPPQSGTESIAWFGA